MKISCDHVIYKSSNQVLESILHLYITNKCQYDWFSRHLSVQNVISYDLLRDMWIILWPGGLWYSGIP